MLGGQRTMVLFLRKTTSPSVQVTHPSLLTLCAVSFPRLPRLYLLMMLQKGVPYVTFHGWNASASAGWGSRTVYTQWISCRRDSRRCSHFLNPRCFLLSGSGGRGRGMAGSGWSRMTAIALAVSESETRIFYIV